MDTADRNSNDIPMWSQIVADLSSEDAAPNLATYFTPHEPPDDRAGYSGRFSEAWSDFMHPDEFTPRDIIAVSALSISIPAKSIARILSDPDLPSLLHELPADVALQDVSAADIEQVLDHMYALNARLRTITDVGPTTASKLMAAKRPSLVPVWDSVVANRLDPPRTRFWASMHACLTAPARNGTETIPDLAVRVLSNARELEPAVPVNLSVLRVIDIVAWRAGTSGRPEQPVPGQMYPAE